MEAKKTVGRVLVFVSGFALGFSLINAFMERSVTSTTMFLVPIAIILLVLGIALRMPGKQ